MDFPFESVVDALRSAIEHLTPLLPLANCHMVDYFTGRLWEQHVPAQLREDLDRLGDEKVLAVLLHSQNDLAAERHPTALGGYVDACERNSLDRTTGGVCTSLDELRAKLGCENAPPPAHDTFMSTKKFHEVEVLSAVVAAAVRLTRSHVVVDAGDGKGYLSSELAGPRHRHLPVLGVDCSKVCTQGAGERLRRMRQRHRQHSNAPSSTYHCVTDRLTVASDLVQMARRAFDSPDMSRVTLAGLHTCGSLGVTCLKLYQHNDAVRALCNVACCHHFLQEPDDFPMSRHLKSGQVPFRLGRNARMLSSQRPERWQDEGRKTTASGEALYWRALLQVLLAQRFPDLELGKRRVGRSTRWQCSSFAEYARIALEKFGDGIVKDDKDLERVCHNLDEKYSLLKQQLHVFCLLRAHLGPCIEAVVLLDRLLYLRERGHTAHLVQMFQAKVSPRCYGIVALKCDQM